MAGEVTVQQGAFLKGELVVDGGARFEGGIGLGRTTTIGDTVVDGKIGVGTANPSQRLHVAGGDAQFDGAIAVGGNAGVADLTCA